VSPKGDLLKKLILYGATTGQKFGAPLDFQTIPGVVLKAAQNTANGLQTG
jgi:hypothetical protein